MSRYEFIDPDTLSDPCPGLARNYVDYWWPVDEKGRIGFFQMGKGRIGDRGSPRCNTHEDIARALEEGADWAVDTVRIPLVSVPHRCGES